MTIIGDMGGRGLKTDTYLNLCLTCPFHLILSIQMENQGIKRWQENHGIGKKLDVSLRIEKGKKKLRCIGNELKNTFTKIHRWKGNQSILYLSLLPKSIDETLRKSKANTSINPYMNVSEWKKEKKRKGMNEYYTVMCVLILGKRSRWLATGKQITWGDIREKS